MYDNVESNFLKDLIDLDEINWSELKKSITDNK